MTTVTTPGVSLGLASVPNLRDAGGWAVGDGRTVKRGLLYRANEPALAPADRPAFEALALRTCFDLRTAAERAARPDDLPGAVAEVWLDILADSAEAAPARLADLFADPAAMTRDFGGSRVERLFEAAYRDLVRLDSARRGYARLFASLLDPVTLPALYHCTTGKDRTGWTSAALLSLLGVPRAAVIEDYLRSNAYILPHFAGQIAAFEADGGDRTIVEAILGVREDYLAAAFDEVEQSFGTIEGYFAEGLGLGDAAQDGLRRVFLDG